MEGKTNSRIKSCIKNNTYRETWYNQIVKFSSWLLTESFKNRSYIMEIMEVTIKKFWKVLSFAVILMIGIALIHPSIAQQIWDFGDAPDPTYPSLLASDGARHADITRAWFGANVSAELDSRQVNSDDFDDGLVSPGPITFSITNNDWAGDLYVNILIDRNNDGDWEDADEWAVQNMQVFPPIAQSQVFQTNVSLPTNLWMRMTLTSISLSNYTGKGAFEIGETEDHRIVPKTPCPCWFRVRVVPPALQLWEGNQRGTFNFVLDPASTCRPTEWEVTKFNPGPGVRARVFPAVGAIGAGMPPAVTVIWDNPCKLMKCEPGVICIRLRGPCRVQSLELRVSFICGPFGFKHLDAGCPIILVPEKKTIIEPGEPVSLIAGVRNFGNDTASFSVSCEIYSGEKVIYHQVTDTKELLPGEPTDLVFPEWLPEKSGSYRVIFKTNLVGDEDPTNDVLERDFEVSEWAPLRAVLIEVKDIYNENLDEVPGIVKKLFGTERINLYITTIDRSKEVYGVQMQDAKIIEFQEGEISKPTMNLYATEDSIRDIMDSDDPVSAFQEAFAKGEITYKGVGIMNKVKLGVVTVAGKIYSFVKGPFGK